MQLFILHHKTAENSYAESLFQLLIQFLKKQQFTITEADNMKALQHDAFNKQNTAFVLHIQKKFLSFFSIVSLRFGLQKRKPHFLIQITDEKIVSSRLPQFIVSNHIEKTISNTIPPTLFFAVCSYKQIQWLTEKKETIATQLLYIPACSEIDYQPISWSDQQRIKLDYTQGREYFLAFAEGKTLLSATALLRAFSSFKKWQHSSMKLVILGTLLFTNSSDWNEKLSTYKYRDDVVLLEHLSLPETVPVLAGAYCFIHTTTANNDVIPLLNAMQCQTCCLSFATDCVEEYAGDAAVLAEQNNYDQLAEKMILLYKDEALRSRLIAQGKERAKQYTKEQTFAALASALALPFH